VIKIGDFVRIDNYEGVIVDMSVNYTKIKTIDGSIIYISNRDISNKNIVNYRFEQDDKEYYVYPIKFTLDRSIEVERVYETFGKIREKYEKELISIDLKISNVSRLEIEYTLIVTIDDADKLLILKPKIIEDIARSFVGT
ncbi:MAG: mechanosensitive ion channel domain-containing protein, partial [Candidatus Njordarchaeota archaeon]